MNIAYWLIPAEPARSFFSAQIHALALQYDAPIFQPHVTVHATRGTTENPAEVLRRALIGQKPIRLFIRAIECSDAFTKTLYVQFHESARLAEVTGALRDASTGAEAYEVNPHLSLLYQKMPLARKREAASAIRLPFGEVVFNSVTAMRCGREVQTRADVESWRTVAAQSIEKEYEITH